MNPEMIIALAKDLQIKKDKLCAKKEQQSLLHNHGQRVINISVNGVPITVCEIQDRSYQSKLIRGREMMLLGAQKAYMGIVRSAEQEVEDQERLLREAMQEQPHD